MEATIDLPLDKTLRIGVQTIRRRSESAADAWLPTTDELRALVGLVDDCRRLTLGTNVFLLPLRHPVPVAKQVATLDHLCEGRLIFGVGGGGGFPKEFAACSSPCGE